MITQENIEQLKPFQARVIIEGLRKGLVPTEYVSFFTVGRQNWLRFVEEDLEQFIAQGGAKVRFVNGDYGDGKTHFMSVIRQLGLQKQFASSFVVLTRSVPIHKFEIVYQEIVLQLQGQFQGIGIRHLLEAWVKQNAYEGDHTALFHTLSQTMDPNFAHALIGLLSPSNPILEKGPQESAEAPVDPKELLYQWFEGKKVPKKVLARFSVFETLNKNNGKNFLQSLVAFLKLTGHKGLIVLFDELETVLAQSGSVRNAAYENIRLLMDNAEQAEYVHFFFSLIPDVLLAEKGFKSYDALWSRVRTVGEHNALNYRGTLIDLHKTPLKHQELIELGVSLRKIHELSYRWDAKTAISNALIAQMCQQQDEMGVLSEVRLFIKQMIRYLDMAEQGNPMENVNLAQHLIESQKETENAKTHQLEPAWDA